MTDDVDMGQVIDHDVNLELLTAPFPNAAIKQRTVGGGRSLSYVEGHTVIHRLNAATNWSWDLRILDITSMQIGNQTVLRAHVRLTIPGLGSREHIGVQSIADRAGEDLVKGAVTDAIKKAATLFGVGLELYGPDYGSGEIDAKPVRAESASSQPGGGDRQSLGILKAGRARGLTDEEVLDVAQAYVGRIDLNTMPRDTATKLWSFITRCENDEILEAVAAGARERIPTK